MGNTATGPLDGIKVVDMSTMISGPLAGMMLADQGADVVKVESPGIGDMMRILGSQKGGMTGIFANNNRGKRSIALDLKQPAGADVVRKLATDADVLIQNFRPGAMARLGLGWDDLRALNPSLIYTSISGYGPDGPASDRRAYDNVIQAASGLADVQRNPRTGTPELYRTLLCDKTTAYTALQAITAALFARATGKAQGQHIELAMLDTAIAFLWPDGAMDVSLLDDDTVRAPTLAANYALTQLADGFAAVSVISDSEFRGYCAALGAPEIADDPRFSSVTTRRENSREMRSALRQAATSRSLEDFVEGAIEHDVPASPVTSLDSLDTDAQVVHNSVFVERRHPIAGMIREPRPAARMSATPQRVSDPAPGLGEHSDAIVSELGLDSAELRATGVLF